MLAHRAPIILAAARNNVPAVSWTSEFARDGGLLSYGPEARLLGVDRAAGVDIFHRAATYIDRILRGAKPGDLPVQFPTKYELIINLKTAKALGLTIPETLLATAERVRRIALNPPPADGLQKPEVRLRFERLDFFCGSPRL
jgi:putative ABC transport system substrate-binding protein